MTNQGRSRQEFEYELLDTGVFVEYAKAPPADLLVQIAVHNRGPEPATLHVLPTLGFRNTWSWGGEGGRPELGKSAGATEVEPARSAVAAGAASRSRP